MATLIAGAIVLGSVSSCLVGFIPFFLALMTALALGVGTASVRGVPLGSLLLPSFALLVTTQLAYGLGLLGHLGLSRLGSSRHRSSSRRANGTRADETVDPLHNRRR